MVIAHKPRPQVASGTSVPAPVGGLNVLNELPGMPPTDMVLVRNFIPTAYGCIIRKGYMEHALGMDEHIQTIMVWNGNTGAEKLFAVDNLAVYDISVPGPIAVGNKIIDSSSPQWQYVNFGNAAGSHLIAFNGSDDGLWYSGAGVKRLKSGDGTADGTWKNIDPKKLVQPMIHQKRLWAVEENSTMGWYLPPEQVFGEAKSFNFGGVFPNGGYLQALAAWTVDSGSGIDDRLVAISSRGDVAIYSGYNPDDAANWKLDGVYKTGATFTRRCFVKYGGDLAILCHYGIVTLSSMMNNVETVAANTLTHKIQKLVSELITEREDFQGWQLVTYPAENLLILNVPGDILSNTVQLAMNTVTGAWTMVTGFKATCWALAASLIFFGSQGAVYRGFWGNLDGVDWHGEGGSPIKAECLQAFTYFDAPGRTKHFKFIRPVFISEGSFTYRVQANRDFRFGGTPPPGPSYFNRVALWNEDIWDGGATWGGGSEVTMHWVSTEGLGYAAAVRLQIESGYPVTWVSTDWVMEKGAII